jgi:type II secretory pathway component PulK
VTLTEGCPAWAILTVLMVVTMTLSDMLNNTATDHRRRPVAHHHGRSLGCRSTPTRF